LAVLSSSQLKAFQTLSQDAVLVIVGVLVMALLASSIAGLVRALKLERAIGQVTRAIHEFASGVTSAPLPEEGPRELRNLVRSFNTLVERTSSQEEARRQLLANLVHELGRPLGALFSAVQALQGGADQEPALRQQLLEGMQSELERLQHLVRDLADLHNRTLGTMELHLEMVALASWLPRVLAPWREAAQRKGLHWQYASDSALPTIQADSDRLAQAMGNLVSNAIKYTPAGGTVSISARVCDRTVQITVADTGPGIPAEELGRIFTPFYRAPSDRIFPQGMGLGLTIARDVVAAHGGTLGVHSTSNHGSRFTITIPLG
jgi:two-component system sensor histidine kinase BaeS